VPELLLLRALLRKLLRGLLGLLMRVWLLMRVRLLAAARQRQPQRVPLEQPTFASRAFS
jgi:hypothetical protein